VVYGTRDFIGLGFKIIRPLAELLAYFVPYSDPKQFPASIGHGLIFSRIHKLPPARPGEKLGCDPPGGPR